VSARARLHAVPDTMVAISTRITATRSKPRKLQPRVSRWPSMPPPKTAATIKPTRRGSLTLRAYQAVYQAHVTRRARRDRSSPAATRKPFRTCLVAGHWRRCVVQLFVSAREGPARLLRTIRTIRGRSFRRRPGGRRRPRGGTAHPWASFALTRRLSETPASAAWMTRFR
jgi:hypothetical protein